MSLPRTLVLILALCALVAGPAAADSGATGDDNPCTDQLDGAAAYTVDVDGEQATGVLSLPDADPRTLIVFAHGYGHTSTSWVDHSRWASSELGAAAVALDYRGTDLETKRGWRVREGAADMIAAARDLEGLCDGFDEIIIFGVSMGGNASGLAVASTPTRLDGTTPLFDWWFNVEGAVNVVETYNSARVLAPANAFAANAVADIEAEMGGTFEEVPEVYAEHAVVNRVDDIAASGVKGVYMVHGVEDGLVPYNQAVEMHALLTEAGVRNEFRTHTTRDDGEAGTTISGYATPGTPLAGHASETSTTHVVMRSALDRLRDLVLDDQPICGARALSAQRITWTVSEVCR